MEKRLEDYKKALYMIDMNNGFVNFGAMANPEYNKLVPEQRKIVDKFRREDELVNFVLEGHDPNATEFNLYPPHCIKGTPEAEYRRHPVRHVLRQEGRGKEQGGHG